MQVQSAPALCTLQRDASMIGYKQWDFFTFTNNNKIIKFSVFYYNYCDFCMDFC